MRLIYYLEYHRLIYGITLDARGGISALNGLGGFEVKAYIEDIINSVGENKGVYSIETENGNLAGYFILEVNQAAKTASLSHLQLRTAFLPENDEIIAKISNFITSGNWKFDFLF